MIEYVLLVAAGVIFVAFICGVVYAWTTKVQMALFRSISQRVWKSSKKCTSQGQGGRGRRIKISTSSMNKHKKRSHKKYRGQGR